MKAISVNEFYSNFKKYIDSIIKGEHIVLFNKNKKIASIEPVKQNGKRPYGLCKGEFTVPKDFNEPLPDDVINSFYR